MDENKSILESDLRIIIKDFNLEFDKIKTRYYKKVDTSINKYYKDFTELNYINKTEVDDIINSQILERKALSEKYNNLSRD